MHGGVLSSLVTNRVLGEVNRDYKTMYYCTNSFYQEVHDGMNDSLEKAEVAEAETQVGYREGAEVARLSYPSIGQGPSPSVEHLEALELELRWGCRWQ